MFFSADGRQLLVARDSSDRSRSWSSLAPVSIWELATAESLGELALPDSANTAMSLSPDNRLLAVGRADGTIWICDGRQWLDRLFTRSVVGVSPSHLQLWDQLGAADPTIAYTAIGWLSQQPDAAVAMLREKLPTLHVEPTAREELDRLIKQLASDDPAQSRQASTLLLRAKPAADAALRDALRAKPSPEVQARLEVLLAAQSLPGDASLRAIRGVQTLERIATPAARELLKSLSAGSAKSLLTTEARLASGRLAANAAGEHTP